MAKIDDFLLRHRLITEDEATVAGQSHPGLSLVDAVTAEGFLTPTLRADAERLLEDGLLDGMAPQLPGLVMLAEVGHGTSGRVFRAWQVSLRRLVAVKVFPKSDLKRKEDRTRFVREARIAARLEHPSLVRAWDIGSSVDWVFIVLEYVEGETLKARLESIGRENGQGASNGSLPVPEVLRIAIAVADGLAYAAVNGITHRDIKPANIQLNDRFTAKVLDLGLARPEGLSETTMPLRAPGTPAYLAPEQARGEARLTPKADVYSLGLVIYRCISGSLPFEAKTPEEMLRHHILSTPMPLAQRYRQRKGDRLPDGLSELVDRMLAKQPEERPDAAEVAGWLRYALAQIGGSTTSGTSGPMMPPGSGQMPTASSVRSTPMLTPTQAQSKSRVPGWSLLFVAVAVIGAVLLGTALSDGGQLEREQNLQRREETVRQEAAAANELAEKARRYATAVSDLARAAAAEEQAGPSRGGFQERLKTVMDAHSELLGDGE